jgi:hypothetical protein
MREVNKGVGFYSTIMVQSPAATLPSFIGLYNNNKLYKKRGHKRVIYSIYNDMRELSSQRTNNSPEKQRNNK